MKHIAVIFVILTERVDMISLCVRFTTCFWHCNRNDNAGFVCCSA